MSFRRLAWTTAALLVVMSCAAIGTVWALPFDSHASAMQARGRDAKQTDVAHSDDPDVSLPVVISEVRPSYTPAALEARIEGEVLLSAVVLTDGTVGEVTVTKSLDRDYGLDDQAVSALKQWRFKPGTKKGQPVAVRVDVEIKFTLK